MDRERRRLQVGTHFAPCVTHLEFGSGGGVLDADEPVHAVEGGNPLGVGHDRHLQNETETLEPLEIIILSDHRRLAGAEIDVLCDKLVQKQNLKEGPSIKDIFGIFDPLPP